MKTTALPDDIIAEKDFLALVHRSKGIITKICWYYAHDAAEYEDLRQDVLAAMWYARSSFRGEAAPSSWVYRVALNTCISALRREKRRGERVALENMPEMAAEESAALERYREMHALIDRLRPDDKAIILLWLDDIPYEEIAAITGMPRNTLATRLRRIKQRLVESSRK